MAWVDSDVLGEVEVAAGPPSSRQLRVRSVPQVEVSVDGVPWKYVPSLLESDEAAEVYRLETDDEGGAVVVFGQGGAGQPVASAARV